MDAFDFRLLMCMYFIFSVILQMYNLMYLQVHYKMSHSKEQK